MNDASPHVEGSGRLPDGRPLELSATHGRKLNPAARLATPDAVLTRTDLRDLGYERRAVDAIFRACAVQVWPGYSKPMIRVADFLEWREKCTYRGDRVRP